MGATAVLALSPGPDNIYVMMQSLVNGRWYGMSTIAGLMTGCIVHTTLIAFGVSALLKQNETLFFILKLFGAFYLLYLAYKVYQTDGSITLSKNSVEKKSHLQLFKQGFIMNVLNPKVSIFFLSFFPGFLFSDTLDTVWQFYILGFLFIAVSFVVFGGLALLAGSVSNYLNSNKSVGIYLKWLQILVFVGIAILIVLSEN